MLAARHPMTVWRGLDIYAVSVHDDTSAAACILNFGLRARRTDVKCVARLSRLCESI